MRGDRRPFLAGLAVPWNGTRELVWKRGCVRPGLGDLDAAFSFSFSFGGEGLLLQGKKKRCD